MTPEGLPHRGSAPRQDAAAKKRADAEYRVGWKMAAIGMEVASMVVAGALLGWGAQALWGWQYSILVGSLTGLAVGMWTLIKGALKLNSQLDAMGPRPRKLGLPEKPASKELAEDDDIPSWRDEWDDWKEDETDERRDGQN